MTEGFVIKLVQESLLYTILIAAPMLIVGMIVGLLVSIIQTATAIQEQTLTFVPKIIAVFIALAIFGAWMLKIMMEYTFTLFEKMAEL